jgi:hypothetical protein
MDMSGRRRSHQVRERDPDAHLVDVDVEVDLGEAGSGHRGTTPEAL